MTLILGIDPGTRITGYGVISLLPSGIQLIDFGCIRPPTDLPLSQRYQILFEGLESLMESHSLNAVSVESQFVLKNVQSAIKLGMAKGMVLLAAARKKIPVYEFAPKQAKLAVVGKGQASKQQVQRMIQSLLKLPHLPEPEDAADALALSICCAHNLRSSPCLNPSRAI
jgi:crossover junction endodeoxyribonuclease RuvC